MEKEKLEEMLTKAEAKLAQIKKDLETAKDKIEISKINHDLRNQQTIILYCLNGLE